MALRWATAALFAAASALASSSAGTSSITNAFTSNTISNKTGTNTPTWSLGQQVTISWTTNYDTVNVGFMQASNGTSYVKFYHGTASSVTWNVNVNKTDWAPDDVVYYMVVANDADPDEGFYSLPVYIVKPGSSPTSLSTSVTQGPTSFAQVTVVQTVTQPQPTATTTGHPAATTTGANANAAAATNTQAGVTAVDSDKLGTGTIAGIAVGAVAGVAALAAAIFFLLRNRRLKRDLMNTHANTRASYMPYDQLPPNSGMAGAGAFSPDPSKNGYGGAAALSPDPSKGAFLSPGLGAGAAVGAGAGVAAGGYYGEKGHSAVSELPVAEAEQGVAARPISELPGGPISFSERMGHQNHDPVEIGGTELTRPMDEYTPHDSRPLMGEHPRDTTD